jgi:hypothetical protein
VAIFFPLAYKYRIKETAKGVRTTVQRDAIDEIVD